jgi:hypothetical protein
MNEGKTMTKIDGLSKEERVKDKWKKDHKNHSYFHHLEIQITYKN